MDEVWAPIITAIGVLAGVLLRHFYPMDKRQPRRRSRRRSRPKRRPRKPRKRSR